MKKYLKFHQNHSIIDRHWRRIEVEKEDILFR